MMIRLMSSIALLAACFCRPAFAWEYENGFQFDTLRVATTGADTTANLDVRRIDKHVFQWINSSSDTAQIILEGSSKGAPSATSGDWFNIDSNGAKFTLLADSTDGAISEAFLRWVRVRTTKVAAGCTTVIIYGGDK